MKYLFLTLFLSFALMASSGLKQRPSSWLEVRAQQQADSTAYEAVRVLDSIYKQKRTK